MFYEVYTQWFSEQSEHVRRICSNVTKHCRLDGSRFKRIENKK